MLSTLAASAVLLSAVGLVNGQTFTDCNPTEKTCPADEGYGSGNTIFTDFTKGASDNWEIAAGTTLSYDTSGAEFNIKASTDAPTISSDKYIMFGQVDVFLKASAGTGIVSSFILESDDLDEIDWEWLGSNDTSVESNFFGKGNTTTYDRAIYHNVASPIETWHNYSITWTAAYTKWYIDGALQRTLNYVDALALGGKNYPQTPMRVKMGSWVGCASAAAAAASATKGTCEWAGGPATFGTTTWTMLVANVTINDFGCGGNYTYSDLTGDWQSIKSSGTCGSTNADSGSDSSSTASASVSKSSGAAVLAQTNTANSGTTLSTATATGSTTKTTGASTTTSGAAQVTTSDGNVKAKSKYGVIDVAVIALGLGLGYLVM
jgi:hypothetical protein